MRGAVFGRWAVLRIVMRAWRQGKATQGKEGTHSGPTARSSSEIVGVNWAADCTSASSIRARVLNWCNIFYLQSTVLGLPILCLR